MRVSFALALAVVALVSAVQAATTEKQTGLDDNRPVAVEEETNEYLLDSRDGGGRDADESDESDSRSRKGWVDGKQDDSDVGRGGWTDDEIEKIIEIKVDENKGDKRGGYNKDNDEDWANDKKVEYFSSGSEKHEDIKPYEKNKQYNDYEKHKDTKPYEKNKKNTYYEKNEEPKSQYGKPLQLSGLAEVISAEQNKLTLNQIYQVNKQNDGAYGSTAYKTPYGQRGHNNQQVLILLKFGRDFESWNPRNNNSQWEFAGTEAGAPADNAAYVVHSGEENIYGTGKWHGEKENGYNAYKPKKDRSYVVQYSLPFNKYYNSSDPRRAYNYYEGAVQTKSNFSIGSTQRFLARAKLACKVINADKHPFPASEVSNPWNDPRLATCFLQVSGDSGLLWFVSVTNTGVWAGYGRARPGNPLGLTFISRRLIGRRSRYDTVVDAAIGIDRREGAVTYYLNGYRAWTIFAIGLPPPDDGGTKMGRGEGVPQVTTVTSVKVLVGTGKGLDESDPNNPGSGRRLVRVQGNSTNYSANETFYDEENRKSSQLWGQGAILTLLKLLVLRAESLILRESVLPGVYGAELPKYQPVNSYHS